MGFAGILAGAASAPVAATKRAKVTARDGNLCLSDNVSARMLSPLQRICHGDANVNWIGCELYSGCAAEYRRGNGAPESMTQKHRKFS
jgi:hypothetical protein